MLGLVHLMKMDGVTESDSQIILRNLYDYIAQLDNTSRESGAIMEYDQAR
jgi:hypothetical protein